MKQTFRKTIKDNRLEELSDRVRRGIPVSMGEAMEVIEYQEQLRKNKLSFTDKILKFFKVKNNVVEKTSGCSHQQKYREYYREGCYKCWECHKVIVE